MAKKRSLLPSRNMVLVTVLISTIASVMVAASQPPSLHIDGLKVTSDVPPVTSLKGEAFVPLRPVAEALGAEMSYDRRTGIVEVSHGKDRLHLRVGDRHATLNGNKMTLKHAPFALRGRLMLGLNTIRRAFGSRVSYDPARAKIEVLSPGMIEAGAQQDSQ
jgi:copper amine oxidase-like protein